MPYQDFDLNVRKRDATKNPFSDKGGDSDSGPKDREVSGIWMFMLAMQAIVLLPAIVQELWLTWNLTENNPRVILQLSQKCSELLNSL